MKKLLFIVASLLVLGAAVNAQNKKAKTNTASGKMAAKPKYPFKSVPVYLGMSQMRSGFIAKKQFDSLVEQGLQAIDSAGVKGSVIQFRLYYKQRMLYEDSAGNYYTDMEMLTDLSKNNKLNPYVDITSRTKKGDTAIFDDILVLLPDSVIAMGQAMKFTITK